MKTVELVENEVKTEQVVAVKKVNKKQNLILPGKEEVVEEEPEAKVLTISDLLEDYGNVKDYIVLIEGIQRCLSSISWSFVAIASDLYNLKRNELYKVAGYKNIYELSLAEFNFKETSTKNFINLAEKYLIIGKYGECRCELKKEYEGYSYSQLVTMLPLSDLHNISSEMTVKEIQEEKQKQLKNNVIDLLENKISEECLEIVSKEFPDFKVVHHGPLEYRFVKNSNIYISLKVDWNNHLSLDFYNYWNGSYNGFLNVEGLKKVISEKKEGFLKSIENKAEETKQKVETKKQEKIKAKEHEEEFKDLPSKYVDSVVKQMTLRDLFYRYDPIYKMFYGYCLFIGVPESAKVLVDITNNGFINEIILVSPRNKNYCLSFINNVNKLRIVALFHFDLYVPYCSEITTKEAIDTFLTEF
jgi:hypothetical protein